MKKFIFLLMICASIAGCKKSSCYICNQVINPGAIGQMSKDTSFCGSYNASIDAALASGRWFQFTSTSGSNAIVADSCWK